VDSSHAFVGQSPQVRKLRRLIQKLGPSDAPVLLLGESGTGKEVVARAIFDAHPRGRFVPIDCGALVGPLMESELFGHVRGAFTGAADNKRGLIELADGGTVFFDEIGDLPLEMQVKLLRLLQEREFRPVGSTRWQKVQLRVIAATHRDLPRLAEQGKFREDLFYRLNIVKITLPPLRDRKEDIPLLLDRFLSQAGRPVQFSRELMTVLTSYEWPGNVRELKNCVERMLAMYDEPVLRPEHLPTILNPQAAGAVHYDPRAEPEIFPLAEVIRRAIMDALAYTGGDKSEAARLLKIGRTTLFRKLKEYNLD
jgi:DNA-binding NtrC family response regulator